MNTDCRRNRHTRYRSCLSSYHVVSIFAISVVRKPSKTHLNKYNVHAVGNNVMSSFLTIFFSLRSQDLLSASSSMKLLGASSEFSRWSMSLFAFSFMKEELIDEKCVFWSRSKNILPRHQIQACFDERANNLNGHNQTSNNDHRRAVVAPCQYYSPLAQDEKILYQARRNSAIA